MTDDTELLRRYAEEGSEAAFTEFVQRHISLVFAAALRRTNGDEHRAVEVAQFVFTDAARRARSLSRHTVVSAWLYVATRNAAANLQRAEARRSKREREAQEMSQELGIDAPAADWERLRPVLDAAMDELNDADREAVLLRFFEHQPFAAIGIRLRLSENAVRMRLERALVKLRMALVRRGVESTTAALAVALANQVVVAAPAGLAASVSGVALANSATAGVGPGAALKSYFVMTTISKITVALVFLVAVAVPTFYYLQPASGSPRQADIGLAPKIEPQEKTLAQVESPPIAPATVTPRMEPSSSTGAHETLEAIIFQGYIVTPERQLFVLSLDKEKTSGWLAIGQNFAGFSLLAFNSKSELLTVEKAGQRQVLHLVDGKIQNRNEAKNPSETKPIVISIGELERITVGDDAAMVDALKAEFALVAAMEPQPAITIRPPNDTKFDRLTLVLGLMKDTGITRFSISTGGEPKRAAQSSSSTSDGPRK